MMSKLPATTENIKKTAELIYALIYAQHSTSDILADLLGVKPNVMKGKCYVASVALYEYFEGNNLTLYRKKDIAGEYHWWCITDDGVTIDITRSQYDIEGLPTPSADIHGAEKMKPLWYPNMKDKVNRLLTLIEEHTN
jgi:hypothetical protein